MRDDVFMVRNGIFDQEHHLLRTHFQFHEADFTLLGRRVRNVGLDVFDGRTVCRLQSQRPVVYVFRAIILHYDVIFSQIVDDLFFEFEL